MIKSMTGFGRGKYENEGRTYNVEIKAVNHKYSDISIKLPRFLNCLEDGIRKKISANVSRGKIDVFITFENYSSIGTEIRLNKELANTYIKELTELSNETGIQNNINVMEIAKFPDVLKIDEESQEELIGKELNFAIDDALNKFIQMREIEGTKLIEDIEKRINLIENKVEEISKYSSTLVQEYIVKLEARVKELLKTDVVDENRIAQEIVIYSDKCSIEEELTRLRSHISQFKKLIKENNSPIGKKFDFLVQEMNRETNTIGSKANNLEITNIVVDIKTILEDIREQIQNIE